MILFIAMSLDGYIVDSKGSVDWLQGQDPEGKTEDLYAEFVTGIDTVLMGKKTYTQIVSELSPEEWPYKGMKSYVFTHHPETNTEDMCFVNEKPAVVVEALRKEPGKNIWICGGARLVQQLMEKDMVDQYVITIIPVILGKGIRLFGSLEHEILLKLDSVRTTNGMTELIYSRRETEDNR